MELRRVGCLPSYDFLKAKREEFPCGPLIPERILALGWATGPAFARALFESQTLQLEGVLRTREQALEFAMLWKP